MPQQREQEEEKREGDRKRKRQGQREGKNEHQMQRDDTVRVYMSKLVRYQKWEQEKRKRRKVEYVCVSGRGSL